ncbi:MAG: hypothetical protein H0T48_08050 [Gemmatimonadaceae bacterium]|nr:hypothetical protein [Gemmatimonadaceae bacterium]
MSNRAGLPVAVVHRWLGRLPVSIIYLRDFREIAGGVGFPSLGPDRATSVEGLKQLTSDIGARRIYTYGNSAGAFPALHYGLNVGARAVLCMAGPTTLTREFNEDMPTFGKTLSRGPAEVPEYAVDMRPLYAAAENPPKVLFVYGTGFPRDRRWAENMGGLPSVQLVPIEGLAEHNVVVPSITSGIFPGLLSRFIALGED